MQHTQVPPRGLIHFLASADTGCLYLGLLFICSGSGGRRARVNGLNSELTPAWRRREAAVDANQPRVFSPGAKQGRAVFQHPPKA